MLKEGKREEMDENDCTESIDLQIAKFQVKVQKALFEIAKIDKRLRMLEMRVTELEKRRGKDENKGQTDKT